VQYPFQTAAALGDQVCIGPAQHSMKGDWGAVIILFPGCTSAQHGTSDEKEEEEETDGGRGGGDDSGDDDDDDDVGMRKIFNING